jgi:hypothetical protein
MFNKICQYFNKVSAVVIGAVIAAPVFAADSAGPDLSALTKAVDFSTVGIAVLSIAALLATVYVSIKGAKIVLAMIRGN